MILGLFNSLRSQERGCSSRNPHVRQMIARLSVRRLVLLFVRPLEFQSCGQSLSYRLCGSVGGAMQNSSLHSWLGLVLFYHFTLSFFLYFFFVSSLFRFFLLPQHFFSHYDHSILLFAAIPLLPEHFLFTS